MRHKHRAARDRSGGGREPEGSENSSVASGVEQGDVPDFVRSLQTDLEFAGTSAAGIFEIPSSDVSQMGGALPQLTRSLSSEEGLPSGIGASP